MGERAQVRLFVALELPAAVVAALVAWRAPLLAGDDGLRPVPAASLHVTLAFLGWRDADEVAPLSAAVAGCAAPVGGLALGAPLWLPSRAPRVLAVALEDRAGELARLHGRVVAALAAGGWHAPEERPFLPHVTVARVRGSGRRDRRAAAGSRGRRGAGRGGPPAAPAWPVGPFAGTAVVLYRSHLGGGGARYEPLVRAAAQGRREGA